MLSVTQMPKIENNLAFQLYSVCVTLTSLWVTNLFLFVQREEKQLEASLDALLSQVADLKNSLGSFIYKLENEYDRLTW